MRAIHRFATIDSTMLHAAELAASGAPDGTVVVAGEQAAGQGRFGRSWHSEKDAGLYMTVILRPNLCPESLPLVTLALGLATAEAITSVAGVACDLRWPNDVLIGSKKCAGILAQLSGEVLLAGIGINVNQTAFPAEIEPLAVSLLQSTGSSIPLDELLDALLDSIDTHMDTLLREGREPVLQAFAQASSYVRGRRVTIEQNGAPLRGTTDGLDPQGFLILRQDNGTRTLILAGGVRPECS